MKEIRTAVIPAAGFGTRFLPETKAIPKEMLPIVDKPVIQYVVEELVEAGINDIIIVTSNHKSAIEDHFNPPNIDLVENLKKGGEKKLPLLEEIEKIANMADFVFIKQEGPYGNGTPLLNVKNLIGDEPFIYAWSDDFIISEPNRFKQLISIYEKYGGSVLAGIKAKSDEDYDRYGFAGGREVEPGVIKADVIIEKPGKANAPSDLATVSGFLFTPDIFKYLETAKSNLKEGEELYYNDGLKLMLADGKDVYAAEIKNGKYYDTGNKLEYLKTVVEFALKRPDIGEEFKEYLKLLNIK
jgi:UTP--glucose-1-phosphate uridylyltransferase